MDFAALMGGLPPINLGLGGTDGDATAHGGRGPTLGDYVEAGASNGLNAAHLMVIGVALVVALIVWKER